MKWEPKVCAHQENNGDDWHETQALSLSKRIYGLAKKIWVKFEYWGVPLHKLTALFLFFKRWVKTCVSFQTNRDIQALFLKNEFLSHWMNNFIINNSHLSRLETWLWHLLVVWLWQCNFPLWFPVKKLDCYLLQVSEDDIRTTYYVSIVY